MHNILDVEGQVRFRALEGENARTTLGRVLRANTRFGSTNFSGWTFSKETIRDRNFESCNFQNCDFEEAILVQCSFRDCDFTGANFNQTRFFGCDFNRSVFRDAVLRSVSWIHTSQGDAVWSGASIHTPTAILNHDPTTGPIMGGAIYNHHNGESCVLDRGFVKMTHRSDTHIAYLVHVVDETDPWRILMGCRFFTFTEAWAHWKATRDGTPLGIETYAILRYFWEIAMCPR